MARRGLPRNGTYSISPLSVPPARARGRRSETAMSRTTKSTPTIEPLEGRALFAGTPLAFAEAAFLGGTQLRIQGTAAGDAITVARNDDGGLVVGNTGGWSHTFSGNYKSLRIDGGAGNDRITLDPAVTLDAILYGGAGNDTLAGGAGDDRLYGGLGANTR